MSHEHSEPALARLPLLDAVSVADAEPAQSSDPLKLYVRQINDGRLLTADEERELARRKDLGDEKAKRILVESNLRLVMSITRGYARTEVPLLDLIQEGNLGLIRAVEKFDHTLGFKLSLFSAWWIRQAITSALAVEDRAINLPAHDADGVRRASAARRQLAQSLSRDPSNTEIAREAGLSVERVVELFALIADGNLVRTPVIEDTGAPVTDVVMTEAEHDEELTHALGRLEPRMRHIVNRRLGLDGKAPQTIDDLGSDLGITRERVRQIETKALRELRALVPALGLQLPL
ncbi:MAG: sigma-70 family RNA polymerase sigma factor [Actinomycetes bacterium]